MRVLVVEDDGPMASMLERGLGRAGMAVVARAHGGSVTAVNRPGGGAAVTLTV